MTKLVGLLINPIAGMGGRVGLKGTDGQEILKEARERGAEPEANEKAEKAIKTLLIEGASDFSWVTAGGQMGADLLDKYDQDFEVIHEVDDETTPEDTEAFLEKALEKDLDIILFVGGDGTARNVASEVELDVPALGIPAGVKIHSPVFASSPENAGEVLAGYLNDEIKSVVEKEVIDIEEEAFRQDEVVTAVYGYMNVPHDERHMQNLKSPSPQSEHDAMTSIGLDLIDRMEEDVYYIIGSGTTLAPIMEELDLDHTKLGVDIIKNKELVKKDASEQDILEILEDDGNEAKLFVTPMGGQGYLFGRGNPQLSDKVLAQLDKKDITIAATPGKLSTLGGRPLLVYTGDDEVDKKLSGYYRVTIGYESEKMYKVDQV